MELAGLKREVSVVKRSRRIGRVAAVLTAATVAVAMAAPVAAAPLDQGTFHDEFSFVASDFCGAGLEVRIDGVVDGQFLVTRRRARRPGVRHGDASTRPKPSPTWPTA